MDDNTKKKLEYDGFKESSKLFFDFFKHLTTLSTGSILLTITFLTKVFQDSSEIGHVANALFSLIVTILASVVAMFFFAVRVQGKDDPEENVTNILATAAAIAGVSFLYGLWSLIKFANANFS